MSPSPLSPPLKRGEAENSLAPGGRGLGRGGFETLVKSFFDKERIIRILNDFILFTRQDDELKKVVLRPHQMRAVQKIVERAEERTKKRGLIWHTQGSGKTYTMIVAAKEIIKNPVFDNPTVCYLPGIYGNPHRQNNIWQWNIHSIRKGRPAKGLS